MSGFNLNKIMIAGNLTRDPESRDVGQHVVANFSLAINRRYKQGNDTKEETTFVDIEAWGRTAELVYQYLTKGSGCFIEGRLKQETWEDKATGANRSRLKVVAESVQFVGGKRDAADGDVPGDGEAPASRQRNTKTQAVADARRHIAQTAPADDQPPF